MNAPKLAGQPRWYLERQLHNFKHGVRGGAPGDAIASQMAAQLGWTAEKTAKEIASLDPIYRTVS
jgi:cytochrome c oxidase subunit 2